MFIRTFRFQDITLHSSGQLWSNPARRESEAGLPAMLVKPSFLDLFNLAFKFTPAKVAAVNQWLFELGEIDAERFNINASMLKNIAAGLAKGNR
jgi:hypothetical protein